LSPRFIPLLFSKEISFDLIRSHKSHSQKTMALFYLLTSCTDMVYTCSMKNIIASMLIGSVLIGGLATVYTRMPASDIPVTADYDVRDFGTEIDTRVSVENSDRVESAVINMANHKAFHGTVLIGAVSERPIILSYDGTRAYAGKQLLGIPCIESGQHSLVRTLGFGLKK
jgi:hypothetical protein